MISQTAFRPGVQLDNSLILGHCISLLSIQHNKIKCYFEIEGKNKQTSKQNPKERRRNMIKLPPNILTFILQCKIHWLSHWVAEAAHYHNLGYSVISLQLPVWAGRRDYSSRNPEIQTQDYSCSNIVTTKWEFLETVEHFTDPHKADRKQLHDWKYYFTAESPAFHFY